MRGVGDQLEDKFFSFLKFVLIFRCLWDTQEEPLGRQLVIHIRNSKMTGLEIPIWASSRYRSVKATGSHPGENADGHKKRAQDNGEGRTN